ncbi:MAG: ABC transporter ATP-binding protein [Phyllobacteriaceae bacterium]|nr:ABC transporter ATP-binding protein [Phyllobacteriaceae bacterium]
MPEIRLENLAKRYGTLSVIEDLNLTMTDGEFTVLVGPSGCGKSTTLRMIAGLESISGGAIRIGERDVSRLEPKERDLAMVFQDYALYPHMNVARNMSFALRLARYPKADIDRRVKAVAETLGLTPYLDRKPAELSGGQRQRVAMGRALVRDASTFLFDEPLSNLDAKLRGQMRAELALMSQRIQKNMIYVTHDQIEAMTLGDRIVVMRHGKIMQQGTPEELYKTPANMFVAGFIGSPPMNFIDVDVSDRSGTTLLTADGFELAVNGADARRLQTHGSGRVTLGVRPSDIGLAFRAASHFQSSCPNMSVLNRSSHRRSPVGEF